MNTQTPKKQKKPRIIIIGTYVVLSLIIVAFVLPSFFSQIGRGGGLGVNVFGTYGNTEIKFADNSLLQQTAQNIDNYYASYSPETRASNFYTERLYREAFDATVQTYALLDIAKQVHFKISKNKLKELIIDSGYFQDADGNFNKKYYDTLDISTKNAYIENIKTSNTVLAVQKNILETAFISNDEIAFYQDLNNQQKSFSYIRLAKNKINNLQVVKDYALANREIFKSIHYKSITFDDKTQAQKIRDDILGNTISFEDAATEYSKDTAKENGGDRGQTYIYQVKAQEGAQTVQSLLSLQNTTDISEIVETQTGNVALYQLVAEIKNIDMDDDASIEIVQDYLATYEPALVEEEGIKDADNFILDAKATSFSQAGLKHNKEVGSISPSPLNVHNISLLDAIESTDGAGIDNLANTEDVLASIYTLEHIKDISSPLVIGNYIYIFQLAGIQSADTSPPDSDASEEDQEDTFATRTQDFIKSTNQKQFKKASVDDNKLVSNFTKAFNSFFQ